MRRVAAASIVIALALVSCSGDDDTGSPSGSDPTGTTGALEPQAGGVLRFGLASESTGFNPASDQFNLSGYQIANAIYDRLVAYDENDVAQPLLAESIEPNDDFTEWLITLRPDIVFHDGTPLDSEVLRMNLQATKDSPLLGQVFTLVEDIAIVEDLTVRVTMSEPWASFPHTLTVQPGLVVAPSVFEEGGSREPVGTGPFAFESWVEDGTLTVTRNDDYWREGYPLLDGIEFHILPDTNSRTASMESGDLDITELRDAGQLVDFEGNDDLDVYLDQQGETTESILLLNTAVPPFDDPLAREAIAYGVDRESIAAEAYAGRFEPANGPFRDGSVWDQDVEFPAYDPDRAMAAVAAYEEENGEPLTFTFTGVADPVAQIEAQLLQQMMGELGIEMELRTTEATQALVDVLAGSFQMTGTDALFGSTHPDREVTFLRGENALPPPQLATNFTRVVDEQIDQGIVDSRATGDPAEQSAAWGEIQEGLARTSAWIFLVHTEVGVAATHEVRDVTTWTFPDGTAGLPQEQNTIAVYQIWLNQ